MPLQLLELGADNVPLLRTLYHLYLYDLNNYSDSYRLTGAGTWEPDYLTYWLEGHEGCNVFLFMQDAQPAGFAMVGRRPFPYRQDDCDQRLCEFFVPRFLRRTGIGTMAARLVFQHFGGAWELLVLPRNQPALHFWRHLLAETNGMTESETREGIRFQFHWH